MFLILGAYGSLLVLLQIAADPSDFSSSGWRIGPNCGVNTAYLYLRLYDVDVTYDAVVAAIPVDDNGCSIEDIRTFATHSGLPSLVVDATPAQLAARQLPVVAHLEQELTNEYDLQRRGHFVVVIAVDSSNISYIDGTTSEIRTESHDRFCRAWSGALVIPKLRFRRGLLSYILLFTGGLIGGYCIVTFAFSPRSPRVNQGRSADDCAAQ